MSFENLSGGAVLLGLAGLAALLFALQRLRVRHREVPVVTTLFWHEAVEDTRARVLVQRFRHPWAYVLVLAITSLVWLALAGPRAEASEGRAYVLLVDGSAGMQREGRLEAARDAVEQAVLELPRDRTRVLWVGADTRSLLLPGEDVVLLGERLDALEPEAAPARIEDELARLEPGEHGTVAVVFGDAPARDGSSAPLTDGLEVVRAELPEPTGGGNRGIVALGQTPAASGAWTRVDVFVEVRGALDLGTELSATLADAPLEVTAERSTGGDVAQIRLRDVLADGGRLTVRLVDADAVAFDDEASIELPVRRPLRVALSPGAAPHFEGVLAADPAVRVVEGEADVAIRRVGESAGGGVPALELVDAAAQEESILITFAGGTGSPEDGADDELLEAIAELGVDEIDAMELAEVAQRPITIGARAGGARGIGLWSELVADERYNFKSSRAFPLFVAQSVRWLAGLEEDPAWVTAGEAVAHADEFDVAGASFAPPRAGTYTSAGGRALHASLPELAADRTASGAMPSEAGAGDWIGWLIALALALAAVEWVLHRTGRMP